MKVTSCSTTFVGLKNRAHLNSYLPIEVVIIIIIMLAAHMLYQLITVWDATPPASLSAIAFTLILGVMDLK